MKMKPCMELRLDNITDAKIDHQHHQKDTTIIKIIHHQINMVEITHLRKGTPIVKIIKHSINMKSLNKHQNMNRLAVLAGRKGEIH